MPDNNTTKAPIIKDGRKPMTLRIPVSISDWLEDHAKERGMSQQSVIMMALGRLRVAVDKGEA